MSLFESASLVVTPNGTKASKLYAIKPTDGSGDLSVTRATTATRVNSSGLISSVASNVPRLDYTNGSCPSILVEPQRTNLVLRSQEFDNSSWIKSNSSITANAATAPDGTLTADKLIEDNNNANHLVQQVISASSASYTFSVFAKKAERNWVVLKSVNASFQNVKAWFNIDAGTIGTLENGATAKITNFSNGWYKLEMTIPSYSTGSEFRISTSTGNGVDSYLGTTGSGVFIWGAQLEAGSYATSYIPTTSASVTRNADVISKTGISDLIGQTEGTIFVDAYIDHLNPSNSYLAQLRATDTSRILVYRQAGTKKIGFLVLIGGSVIYSTLTSGSISGNVKIAAAYKSGSFAFYVNGVQINVSSSSLTISPTLTQFNLDSNNGIENGFFSYNSSALWKERLTNAELAELTTL